MAQKQNSSEDYRKEFLRRLVYIDVNSWRPWELGTR